MERRRETETSGETDRNGWRESNPCVTCHNAGLSANARERQNQTPPVWKTCTEMTDPDVKI